eukprot:scaffold137954_cov31-Tisochrysis_lutea.AAC.3
MPRCSDSHPPRGCGINRKSSPSTIARNSICGEGLCEHHLTSPSAVPRVRAKSASSSRARGGRGDRLTDRAAAAFLASFG